MGRTPEYKAWDAMRYRCTRPQCTFFHNYGGRGITVCDRWMHSFANFLADVGPRPSKGHTLERVDNARGYEPGNVRWATMLEQAKNRRTNRRVMINGETLILAEWARRTGISTTTLHNRLIDGWPMEEACTTPKTNRHWRHRNTTAATMPPSSIQRTTP